MLVVTCFFTYLAVPAASIPCLLPVQVMLKILPYLYAPQVDFHPRGLLWNMSVEQLRALG